VKILKKKKIAISLLLDFRQLNVLSLNICTQD